MATWYAIVGDGAQPPGGQFETDLLAAEARLEWGREHPFDFGKTRVYVYKNKATARKAEFSDAVGENGRIG